MSFRDIQMLQHRRGFAGKSFGTNISCSSKHGKGGIDVFSIHMQDLTAKDTPPLPLWTASVPQ